MPKPKRKRIEEKRKRSRRRGLAVLITLLVVAGIAASFVGYGVHYGAVVDFSFGGSSDVRQSYNLTAMSRLQAATIDITHILVRNTGTTAITVVVTMHALNAAVSAGYYGPYSNAANIQIDLRPASGYQVVTFFLTLPLQASTFTLHVTVGRVLDLSSVTSLATSSLSPVQPTSPTTLVYTHVPASPTNYELTQQY